MVTARERTILRPPIRTRERMTTISGDERWLSLVDVRQEGKDAIQDHLFLVDGITWELTEMGYLGEQE